MSNPLQPTDCSLPGSSVHRILQARGLEWGAISFSTRSSDPGIEPGSPALQADALTSEPPGKPPNSNSCYNLYAYLLWSTDYGEYTEKITQLMNTFVKEKTHMVKYTE